MFSIKVWDGLAKIGNYKVGSKNLETPALFPVVDPYKEEIPIKELKSEFKFDQVITSAYLMSKRLVEKPLIEYPKIHDYLNFDGVVMMDSGAYQVMLYGDIELGVLETLELQNHVKTDIGVIMDHPIGFDVKHDEAERRIQTTLKNIETSIPTLQESDVKWTLPIQGGRFTDLMAKYLDKVTKPEIINNFNFYALGSVVPVMINQRYDLLVEMITTARSKLPVTQPLHLFGAGHPSMFALAIYLGCDSFDSAAYILMAKDGRYMTVNGTLQLEEIREFPCYCKVCSTYTVGEMKKLDRKSRTKLLARHNLWVSAGEINTIKHTIRDGTLWDLVQQRASAVPNLFRATRYALKLLEEGPLWKHVLAGTPISTQGSIRVIRPQDVKKPIVQLAKNEAKQYLENKKIRKMIIWANEMREPIYNKFSMNLAQIKTEYEICFLLPPLGLIPARLFDIFPFGQMQQELDLHEFDATNWIDQINQLLDNGISEIKIFANKNWKTYLEKILGNKTEIIFSDRSYNEILEFLKD